MVSPCDFSCSPCCSGCTRVSCRNLVNTGLETLSSSMASGDPVTLQASWRLKFDEFCSPSALVLCSLPVHLWRAGYLCHVNRPPCTVRRVCPIMGLPGQFGGCPYLARGQHLCEQVLMPHAPALCSWWGLPKGRGEHAPVSAGTGCTATLQAGTAGDGHLPSPGLSVGHMLCPSWYELQSHLRGRRGDRPAKEDLAVVSGCRNTVSSRRTGGGRGQEQHRTCDHRCAECRLAHQRPCLPPPTQC